MPLWALPLCRLAAGAAPVAWPWVSAAPCGLTADGYPLKCWAKIKLGHRAKVRTIQWDLAESSLGVRRREREAHWEHAGRSLEEDHKTHCKNTGGCRISES
ncbi:hypothetical protein GW17_00002891 [Ensete ventricosum]|nr:hypothetical protein GW17_00002891 [Ensete ventricosum]